MVLPSNLSIGMDLSKALELEDFVLDLEITANRGDCLSVIGIAREIAALTGQSLRFPSCRITKGRKQEEGQVGIEIEDLDLCPYYSARLIRNVKVEPSPQWLYRKILISGGIPINNVVDITNYVLWEIGQPLHAFDCQLLQGKKIIVRRARKNEFLVTLDGVRHELDEEMLVIADLTHPVALAGIMGGEDTQVTDSTVDVLLESAYFDALSIQKTSRKLGLTTEASSRFARQVDPLAVRKALDRASLFIGEVAGGELEEKVLEKGQLPVRRKQVTLRPARVHRILGSRITPLRMKTILNNLQFQVEERGKNWQVDIPSFRPDISREIDLIEEIIRFYGYNELRVSLPSLVGKNIGENLEEQGKEEVRELLRGLGFYEVISIPFAEEESFRKMNLDSQKKIRIRNPLSSQQEFLMTHLFPRLLKILSYNLTQNIEKIRIFELSEVFPNANSLKEATLIGGLVCEDNFDFFSLKGIVEALLEDLGVGAVEFVPCECSYLCGEQRASVLKENVVLGALGRLNQEITSNLKLLSSVYLFEFDFSRLVAFSQERKMFRRLPKFPALRRDLAIVVEERIPAEQVKKEILKAGKWLEEVEVFDLYRGKGIQVGHKSLTFSLVFRAPDRTLRDEEVDRVQQRIVNLLKAGLGADIRKE